METLVGAQNKQRAKSRESPGEDAHPLGVALHVEAVYLGREAGGARAHHQLLVYLLELAAAPRAVRAGAAPLQVGVQLLELVLLLVLVLGTRTILHLAAARPLAALEWVPRPLLPRSLPLDLLLRVLAVEAASEDVLQRVLAAT